MRPLFRGVALLAVLSGGILPTTSVAQSVPNDFDVLDVIDWGSGFNARFRYTIAPDDVSRDRVRHWRIDMTHRGAASLGNVWMSGYPGAVKSGFIGPGGRFSITTEGDDHRPELDAGFDLIFNVQGQGGGFSPDDFTIDFVNLTVPTTPTVASELVSVNDWFNPAWGGGYNATFRCDVSGPDAANVPVNDLLIAFNYSGSGTPITAWTQSHAGTVEIGYIAPDGGYAIANKAGFQPELVAGDSITFAIQVNGARFHESDFDIRCESKASEVPNGTPVVDAIPDDAADDETVVVPLIVSDGEAD